MIYAIKSHDLYMVIDKTGAPAWAPDTASFSHNRDTIQMHLDAMKEIFVDYRENYETALAANLIESDMVEPIRECLKYIPTAEVVVLE